MVALPLSFLLEVCIVLITLATVSGQPSFVSTNKIKENYNLFVQCDASRANTPQASVRGIQALSIYRMVETDSNFSLVAKYNSVNPPNSNADVKNIPPGRNWNIRFSGGNEGSNNTATMKIELDVQDSKCNDSGIYRCQIDYYLTAGGSISVQAPDQNVTVTMQTLSFKLDVDPILNIYTTDDKVTFTCSINAPLTDITMKWELEAKNQQGNYEPQYLSLYDEVVDTPPAYITGRNSCALYKWVSTLTIQVPADYWQKKYSCVVNDIRMMLTRSMPWILGASGGKQPPSIVSTNTIISGRKLSVYCDSHRSEALQANVRAIQTLYIYRMGETSKSYSPIAKYDSSPHADNKTNVKNIPAGRQWTITFSGDNKGSKNIATMQIVWDLNDAGCNDAGMYRCDILYHLTNGSSVLVQAPDQNVTYRASHSEVCSKVSSSSGSFGLRMTLTLGSFIIYLMVTKL